MTLEAIEAFKAANPTFIGMAQIVAEGRNPGDFDLVEDSMNKAVYWHEK